MSNSTSSHPHTLAALETLIAVVAKLRSPEGGCPWDLAQTPESLTPYIIEEAYETVDAIRNGTTAEVSEELGDLLLQVVLQAQIASEGDRFSLQEVAEGISEKLIRRHPHVFGEETVENVEQVRQNWEQIKAEEKGKTEATLADKLDRYARTLPPLDAGMKISKKAAAAGFEWETIDGVWEKFDEELGEFKTAIASESPARQQEELGDLLFVIINLARWYKLDPSAALQQTNRRFVERFSRVEAACDRPLSEYTLAEFEALWQQVKQAMKSEQ